MRRIVRAAIADGGVAAEPRACHNSGRSLSAAGTVAIPSTGRQIERSLRGDVDGLSRIVPGGDSIGIAEASRLYLQWSASDRGRGGAAGGECVHGHNFRNHRRRVHRKWFRFLGSDVDRWSGSVFHLQSFWLWSREAQGIGRWIKIHYQDGLWQLPQRLRLMIYRDRSADQLNRTKSMFRGGEKCRMQQSQPE